MSNPILELAHSIANQPIKDASPAERLADALLEATRDNTAMAMRVSEYHKRCNALSHENEQLREALIRASQAHRGEPAVRVYCDAPNCTTSPLSSLVPIQGSAVREWVFKQGWLTSEDGFGHLCPQHIGDKP